MFIPNCPLCNIIIKNYYTTYYTLYLFFLLDGLTDKPLTYRFRKSAYTGTFGFCFCQQKKNRGVVFLEKVFETVFLASRPVNPSSPTKSV